MKKWIITNIKFSSVLVLVILCAVSTGSLAYEVHATNLEKPLFLAELANWSQGLSQPQSVTSECELSLSSTQLQPALCHLSRMHSFSDRLLNKINYFYNTNDPKLFQKLEFTLKPGLKIRGLLGLQPEKNRPLVIFRMGIHGNLDQIYAENFLVKIIHHDLKMNILVLESLTSSAFSSINHQLAGGGMEEGLHTFFILNLIVNKKLSWAKEISDIYLVGVSMSGIGMFLTTYLDQYNQNKIKTVQMFCPLINLQSTVQRHFHTGLFPLLADLWTRYRQSEVLLQHPEFDKNFWKSFYTFEPQFTPLLVDWLNQNYTEPFLDVSTIKKEFPGVKIPPELERHLQSKQSYFQMNNIWDFYKTEKTPISIYLTPNDPLVMNNLNSEMIRQGHQPGVFKNMTYADLKGIHCALAREYQWPFLVELLKRGFKL